MKVQSALRFYRSMFSGAVRARQSSDALDRLRLQRLRELVVHADHNVPFYARHFRESGFHANDIHNIDDLWRLPPVTKADIIDAGDDIRDQTVPADQLREGSSSGTSGRRLKLFATPMEMSKIGGIVWGLLPKVGIGPRDRIVSMASRYFAKAPPPYRSLPLHNADGIESWLADMQRFRPTAIVGQLEPTAFLAEYLLRHPDRAAGAIDSLKHAVMFGWTLTPDLRQLLKDGLGVDPIDAYATSEVIWAGLQCHLRDGFHIPHDRLIVQVAKAGDPHTPADDGQVGELIYTELSRTTMPFIRYRIGDAGAVTTQPCTCGQPGPRIVQLLGRMVDVLVSTDQLPVRPTALGLVKFQREGVLQDYDVVQNSPTRLSLQWVPGPRWSSDAMQAIKTKFKSALGPIQIKATKVESIPTPTQGKRRRIRRAFDVPDEIFARFGTTGS